MNSDVIQLIIAKAGELVGDYLKIETEARITNGNVSICIIEEDGTVHGKLYGENKIKNRDTYRIAWIKASQVWITGIKTGEYEKLVFNNQIDEHQFGISRPDLIGWEGGQPVLLKDGTRLSIAFSGFTGKTDLEIVQRAIAELGV